MKLLLIAVLGLLALALAVFLALFAYLMAWEIIDWWRGVRLAADNREKN